MSEGMAAYGTLLAIGDAATPETFENIAEVNSISGPSLTLDPIELTHHESPGAWKEFVGGLLDGGEITLDVNFLPTEQTHTGDTAGSLLYCLTARVLRNFELTWPDTSSTTWAFAALVTSFEVSAPVDDKLAASVTLKISGAPSDLLV